MNRAEEPSTAVINETVKNTNPTLVVLKQSRKKNKASQFINETIDTKNKTTVTLIRTKDPKSQKLRTAAEPKYSVRKPPKVKKITIKSPLAPEGTINPNHLHISRPSMKNCRVVTVDDPSSALGLDRIPRSMTKMEHSNYNLSSVIKTFAPSPFEFPFIGSFSNETKPGSLKKSEFTKMAGVPASERRIAQPPTTIEAENPSTENDMGQIEAEVLDLESFSRPSSQLGRSLLDSHTSSNIDMHQRLEKMVKKLFRKGSIRNLTHYLEPKYYAYQERLISISLHNIPKLTEDERVKMILDRCQEPGLISD